ncbi:MAG: hypothetical protein ACK5QT_07900 [Oligoflexia bacterium]
MPLSLLRLQWVHAYEIKDFWAEEAQIHTREFKKVDLSARIELAPGETAPQLNLVQVTEQGERMRFLGILLHHPKKGRWTRRVELLERESGALYFEIVPEAELEPFVKRERPRAVIQVFKRPSLIEILKKVLSRFGFQKAEASERRVFKCPEVPPLAISRWGSIVAPELPGGVRGYSSERRKNGKEQGAVGAITAQLARKSEEIVEFLWNPANLKDPKRATVQVTSISPLQKRVEVDARPIFFLNIKWTELWERSGTESAGGSRIRYAKTEGDSRLSHFCGWMDIEEVSSKEALSRVTLYEEVWATGRSPEDVLNGHIGTLRQILQSTSSTR